jgi:putative spermidine/putrescine transport system ATP-binding protein
MSDGYLALERLTLAHGTTIAVDALDLAVRKGEMIALLGPSGCGKTTTMRAIAGLLEPRSGTIRLDGRDITRLPPNRRGIGLVFQSYALFPHLTVNENLAFGLRLQHLPAATIAEKVAAMLATVGLASFGGRLPRELSGGQQQRVALARAMVVEPRLLLLDEPLSNLDAHLRMELRGELQRLQRRLGTTMIYVTHDQTEALALADRVAVMRAGRIEQLADPETLFGKPATRFVARFMGFENLFALKDGALEATGGARMALASTPSSSGIDALAWRPRDVAVGTGPYAATVLMASYLGETLEYLLATPIGEIKAAADAAGPRFAPGSRIAFDLPLAKAAPLAGQG